MKKVIIVILLGSIFIPNLYSQVEVDSEIKDFLVKSEQLEDDSRVSMYAYELLSNEEWNKNVKYGIYRIGIFSSHAWPYLLFIDDGKKYFVEDCIFNISRNINSLFTFFENSKHKYTDSEKLAYIKKLLERYNFLYSQYSDNIYRDS